MGQSITSDNLVHHLRDTFPDLEDCYRKRVDFWKDKGEPSNYDVIGSVLRPKLKEELSKREQTEFLKRTAAFVERVCSSGDLEAINVIWIEIFEWLIFRPEELSIMWRVMGPATKRNIKDAAQRWSKAGRRFGHTQGLAIDNLPKEE